MIYQKYFSIFLSIIFIWFFAFISAHPLLSGFLNIDILLGIFESRFYIKDYIPLFFVIGLFGILMGGIFFLGKYNIHSFTGIGGWIVNIGIIISCYFIYSTPAIIYQYIGEVFITNKETSGYHLDEVGGNRTSHQIPQNTEVILQGYYFDLDSDSQYRFSPFFCTKENICFRPWGIGEREFYKNERDPRRGWVRFF